MLGNAVNFMERKTGLDIDGDGDVGETDKQQHMMRMMTQPRAQSNQVTNTSNLRSENSKLSPVVPRLLNRLAPFGILQLTGVSDFYKAHHTKPNTKTTANSLCAGAVQAAHRADGASAHTRTPSGCSIPITHGTLGAAYYGGHDGADMCPNVPG